MDECLCATLRRSAVYPEKLFPESGGTVVRTGDAPAGTRLLSAEKGISAVSGTACHGGNAGDPVQFLRDRSSGTVASILNKMSPFFAILCSWIFLREKLNWKQGLIVLGAFVGALCVIKPTFANADLFPSLIGLLGGFGAGVAYTMVRRLGQIGENKAYIVFFFSAFSCVVTLPYLLFCYEPMTWKQLLCLVMAGLSAAGGQFGVTSAYCYAPAKEISVYDYTQIIFAAGLGFLLFAQIPDWLSILGYCIIIAMAVVMFFYNKESGK